MGVGTSSAGTDGCLGLGSEADSEAEPPCSIVTEAPAFERLLGVPDGSKGKGRSLSLTCRCPWKAGSVDDPAPACDALEATAAADVTGTRGPGTCPALARDALPAAYNCYCLAAYA